MWCQLRYDTVLSMLAMQYTIPLPPNFDADAVRARVSQRRALFDSHSGLEHKSFVYCPKEHVYAPFYVWKNIQHAQHFLLDELYQGVVESFGRHRVRSWYVIAMSAGEFKGDASFAMRETDTVPTDTDLKHFALAEREKQLGLVDHYPEMKLHITALDAERWEVMRFSLWQDEVSSAETESDCLQTYEVLHVSAPK